MDRYDETNIHFSAKKLEKVRKIFWNKDSSSFQIFTAVSAHLFTFKASTYTGKSTL